MYIKIMNERDEREAYNKQFFKIVFTISLDITE